MNNLRVVNETTDFSLISKTELLKRWPITIEFLDLGCVVRVGCKSIAFDNVEKALAEFEDYCKDPHAAIKEWRNVIEI